MSRRYSNAKLLDQIQKRRIAIRDLCENCGTPGHLAAAHRKSRNLTTKQEIETQFFLVHNNLHIFEHTRANNLRRDPCVARYIDLYGESFDPWPPKLEFTPSGWEHGDWKHERKESKLTKNKSTDNWDWTI